MGVLKHKEYILEANPKDVDVVDPALRCALTNLLTGDVVDPPPGSEVALRYVRDRVNVPRDMTIWAARRLREALEDTKTRALLGNRIFRSVEINHRCPINVPMFLL